MTESSEAKRDLLAERPGPSTYFDDDYYARLVDIAGAWDEPGPALDTDRSREIELLLYRECRLLDDGRLEDWLELEENKPVRQGQKRVSIN